MSELLKLCWELFKAGLFAIGGGMATIPFLAQIAKSNPHWFTLHELADMIAIAESTPGPIGVNIATYAGYHVLGAGGGILATLSLVLPSFLIMLPISKALQQYRNNTLVNAAFLALRPAVTGLIAAAGLTVLQMAVIKEGGIHITACILFVLILLPMQLKKGKKLHPIVYIGVAAIAGILLQM